MFARSLSEIHIPRAAAKAARQPDICPYMTDSPTKKTARPDSRFITISRTWT